MRKVETFIVPRDAGNRDAGKVFVLTEMSAAQGDWLAKRVFLALARSGVDIPEEVREQGLAGLAVYGIKALRGIRPEDLKPLEDELMACVKIRPDPKHPEIVRNLVEDGVDIEEVSTRWRLQSEVIKLHVGFSIAGYLSQAASQTMK
jgi:hypothetical protein